MYPCFCRWFLSPSAPLTLLVYGVVVPHPLYACTIFSFVPLAAPLPSSWLRVNISRHNFLLLSFICSLFPVSSWACSFSFRMLAGSSSSVPFPARLPSPWLRMYISCHYSLLLSFVCLFCFSLLSRLVPPHPSLLARSSSSAPFASHFPSFLSSLPPRCQHRGVCPSFTPT